MTARRLLRLLPALAVLVLVAAVVSACDTEPDKSNLSEGEPFELGDLQYNVLFSRFLNPDDIEDSSYLLGQPAPKPHELYLGVFLEVINKGSEPAPLPKSLTVNDTANNEYVSLPSESLYSLGLGGELGPEDQAPADDSTAQAGPIEGSMVLFVIPDAATQDRPLTLVIPGEDGPAEVELDI
jgi:hypothetical protein